MGILGIEETVNLGKVVIEAKREQQSLRNLARRLLAAFLEELQHAAYDDWQATCHNLDHFGYTTGSNHGETLSYWVFLTRIYNRCAYLQARLRLRGKLPPENSAAIRESIHLRRLGDDFARAQAHLYDWLYGNCNNDVQNIGGFIGVNILINNIINNFNIILYVLHMDNL